MNQCTVCSGELVDTLSIEFRREGAIVIDPLSAAGRRIQQGLCWVCKRLRDTASKDASGE